VRALAEQGKFFGCDVGDSRWIDVDTPEAFLRAEAMIRVFGDTLGDEPAAAGSVDGEGMELFAPTWVRAAQPYKEDHFELASSRKGLLRMMSNESPFAPSERVIQAIVDATRQGNLYPTGGTEVRRRLGGREGLDESHVVLGAGSTELIDRQCAVASSASSARSARMCARISPAHSRPAPRSADPTIPRGRSRSLTRRTFPVISASVKAMSSSGLGTEHARRARAGRVEVIGASVAKTAVAVAAVTPGGDAGESSPTSKLQPGAAGRFSR
jgi:hypothetical protein